MNRLIDLIDLDKYNDEPEYKAFQSLRKAVFQFVWFTDGTGRASAKHNIEETFDVLDNLYNLEDLEKGAIDTLLNPTEYIV